MFDAGYSTTRDGTGLDLHVVSEAAGVHGWTVAVTESESGGLRFEPTGVEFA